MFKYLCRFPCKFSGGRYIQVHSVKLSWVCLCLRNAAGRLHVDTSHLPDGRQVPAGSAAAVSFAALSTLSAFVQEQELKCNERIWTWQSCSPEDGPQQLKWLQKMIRFWVQIFLNSEPKLKCPQTTGWSFVFMWNVTNWSWIYDTKEACRPVWNQNRKRDRSGPGGRTVEKEGPNRQVLCGNLFPRQCVSSREGSNQDPPTYHDQQLFWDRIGQLARLLTL